MTALLRKMVLVLLVAAVGASSQPPASDRMADGKRWLTRNLDIPIAGAHCYDDAGSNRRQYGRLYTWESALAACQVLGKGWRLPTDGEWRRLAKLYGGISADSADKGQAAFQALLAGKFHAVLGGGRASDGQYTRGNAHGFYWTATSDDTGAVYYNFGAGGKALHRQVGGEKAREFSVRCVRD